MERTCQPLALSSNWEAAKVCLSESFESLSKGLQSALWEWVRVRERHRTNRMLTAVNNALRAAEFTGSSKALLRYFGMEGEKIQAGRGNENGAVEQWHPRRT